MAAEEPKSNDQLDQEDLQRAQHDDANENLPPKEGNVEEEAEEYGDVSLGSGRNSMTEDERKTFIPKRSIESLNFGIDNLFSKNDNEEFRLGTGSPDLSETSTLISDHTPVATSGSSDNEKKPSMQGSRLFSLASGSNKGGIRGDFQGIVGDNISLRTMDLGSPSFLSFCASSISQTSSTSDDGIDRQMYYRLHEVYSNMHNEVKLKNNYLQKKLADYYKTRRMEQVFVERGQVEYQKRYYELLDSLDELQERKDMEIEVKNEEIEEMKKKRDKNLEENHLVFDKLQQLQFETAKDLMLLTETDHMTKVMERNLKRQRYQLGLVIKMRLEFIKIRNKLTEKQDALNALDNLGPNLHLIDYEQLKVDNRNRHDKLEEKENQLIHLRNIVQSNMQALAHRREKAAHIDSHLRQLIKDFDTVMDDYNDVRETMNMLKVEKDTYRDSIYNLKESTGLLTKKNLLMDMENVINEVKEVQKELNYTKDQFLAVSRQVENLRKNLEIAKMRNEEEDESLQL